MSVLTEKNVYTYSQERYRLFMRSIFGWSNVQFYMQNHVIHLVCFEEIQTQDFSIMNLLQ